VIISPVAVSGNVSDSAGQPVRGKVTDETGKPLGGVTVKLVNSPRTVVTDEAGNFSIEVPAGGSLEITYIGYKGSGRSEGKPLSVELQLNAAGLADAVVVVMVRSVSGM